MQGTLLDTRSVISLEGAETGDFLQGLITNDTRRVSPERSIYAALLTPQGKFLHDFFMVRHDMLWLVECARERRDDLLRRLTMYRLRRAVEIRDRSEEFAVAAFWNGEIPCLAGQDRAAGSACEMAGGRLYRDPRLAALGARAILPQGRVDEAFTMLGANMVKAQTYHAHRIALGVPESGVDIIVDKTLPLEANFDQLNGVDFRKGCFIGQEQTARTKHRGTIRRRLFPVRIDGVMPETGTKVMHGEKSIGEIRSREGSRAIAHLRIEDVREAEIAGTPLLADGARLEVITPEWMETENNE